MIDAERERLAALTRAVDAIAKERQRTIAALGSHARTPILAMPSIDPTRPDCGPGVTFHVKHSFVSRGSGVARRWRRLTSAPSDRRCIDRPGATEVLEERDGTQRRAPFATIGDGQDKRIALGLRVEGAEGERGQVQCRMIVELPHEPGLEHRVALARAARQP